jgi:AcrR family transcriptional regulator
MKTPEPRTTTRTDLLDAAYRVLLRDGPGSLTLDAVVRETGRSKGGVLYHFPTKDALIAGMVGLVLDRFDADVEQAWAAAGDDGPGGWLRAYVAASVKPDPDAPAVGAGLLAVVAANPGLLDLVREHTARWQARIEADGVDPVAATIVRLAVDSLSMEDLFGITVLTPERRAGVLAAVVTLTRKDPE